MKSLLSFSSFILFSRSVFLGGEALGESQMSIVTEDTTYDP